MNAAVPTLDLIRRLAERHARVELETHGRVIPSALLFHSNTTDVVYPNENEAWSHFVQHMLAERTEYKAHAIALFRQVSGDVALTIMPSSGVWIELRIPVEVA